MAEIQLFYWTDFKAQATKAFVQGPEPSEISGAQEKNCACTTLTSTFNFQFPLAKKCQTAAEHPPGPSRQRRRDDSAQPEPELCTGQPHCLLGLCAGKNPTSYGQSAG